MHGAKPPFVENGIYHLYNRGVAKQEIFITPEDYQRFLLTLSFYIEANPGKRLSYTDLVLRRTIDASPAIQPLVEILAYCLMPNHFHLVVRQRTEGGVSMYMRRALNSYTRAFNARRNRVGPIFQGVYQAVNVENDEQFLHLTRYVHLNPFVARLVDNPNVYPWSSYRQILEERDTRLCRASFVLALASSSSQYGEFVRDYAAYARDLAEIKAQLIDIND